MPAESIQAIVDWLAWAIRRHLERPANQEQAPEPAPEPPGSWLDRIITLLDRKQEEGAEPEQTPADTEISREAFLHWMDELIERAERRREEKAQARQEPAQQEGTPAAAEPAA